MLSQRGRVYAARTDIQLMVKAMALRSVSKEALVGSVTLGLVFVVGYFFGKSDSVKDIKLN